MGRQHTIYLSDVTWKQLQSLKKEDQTMSEVIRMTIAICHDNQDSFDLLKLKEDTIKAHQSRIKYITSHVCLKCQVAIKECKI